MEQWSCGCTSVMVQDDDGMNAVCGSCGERFTPARLQPNRGDKIQFLNMTWTRRGDWRTA